MWLTGNARFEKSWRNKRGLPTKPQITPLTQRGRSRNQSRRDRMFIETSFEEEPRSSGAQCFRRTRKSVSLRWSEGEYFATRSINIYPYGTGNIGQVASTPYHQTNTIGSSDLKTLWRRDPRSARRGDLNYGRFGPVKVYQSEVNSRHVFKSPLVMDSKL